MRACLWTALGLTAFVLAGDTGAGEDRTAEKPPQGKRPASAMPSQRIINGGISRHYKSKNMRFEVVCHGPGSRTSQIGLLLKVDESSLLLRADGDGRFHRVEFADLFQGDKRDHFQAGISWKFDSDQDALVSWLVLYSSPKDSPMPIRPLKIQ